jgi:glycosyltransferase involved in cell wall biosynthesis
MSTNSTITTIILTYFDNHMPFENFVRCVNSVSSQTLKPDHIIISDDSKLFNFEERINILMRELNLNYSYIRNTGSNGMGTNSNFALGFAKTEYVHILHADDLLLENRAYELMLQTLMESDKTWLFCSGMVEENFRKAEFSWLLVMGINTLGGPSGMFATREAYIKYNPKLRMFVDIDQYLRLEQTYGVPKTIDFALIKYGVGDWQVQKKISRLNFYKELRDLIELHPVAWKKLRNTSSIQWQIRLIFTYFKLSFLTFNKRTIIELFQFTRTQIKLKELIK